MNYVNISGLTVQNATGTTVAGIRLEEVSNCNISGNAAVNFNYCIYLSNALNNNITCNWVHGNTQRGFHLAGGSTGNNICLVIVYQSLAVKWSDRYTFMNIIAVGIELIDLFAKMNLILSFVYVKFNCLRSSLTISLSTFSILPFRFKAILSIQYNF
ncbi:copper-binding protein (NosD) [Candidatus Methanophagaceae archaeon]|nr:copper-binding protein (NosD) [Methanophagales archaeon]